MVSRSNLSPESPRTYFHQVPEACRLLGIGRSTLYQLIADGKLAAVTIGRRRLVAASEIERFANELTEVAHERRS